MPHVIHRSDTGEYATVPFCTRELVEVAIVVIFVGGLVEGFGIGAASFGFLLGGLALIAAGIALMVFAPRIVQRKVIAALRAANGEDDTDRG